eukprot:scaffold55635_cov48-Phaeocystis_antarctica.AAC.2
MYILCLLFSPRVPGRRGGGGSRAPGAAGAGAWRDDRWRWVRLIDFIRFYTKFPSASRLVAAGISRG